MGLFGSSKKQAPPKLVATCELLRHGQDGTGSQLVVQLPSAGIEHSRNATRQLGDSGAPLVQSDNLTQDGRLSVTQHPDSSQHVANGSHFSHVGQEAPGNELILYTIEIAHKTMGKDAATIFRGDKDLMAKIKSQNITFEPGHRDFKRREIVFRKSRFADRRAFRYQNEAYHFKSSPHSQALYLYSFRHGKKDHPLAAFEPSAHPEVRGMIRIYDPGHEDDSLIVPTTDPETGAEIFATTQLFDIALVAYYCVRSFLLGSSIVKCMQTP